MSQRTYTDSEMMIAVAARVLKGARTVFVGVSLPNIACNLARAIVAPELELIYKSAMETTEMAPLTSVGSPIESGSRSGRAP